MGRVIVGRVIVGRLIVGRLIVGRLNGNPFIDVIERFEQQPKKISKNAQYVSNSFKIKILA